MSGKRQSSSNHSQGAPTLEIEVEFEWSLRVRYISIEPHSHEVVINNMANACLERIEHYLGQFCAKYLKRKQKLQFQPRNVW